MEKYPDLRPGAGLASVPVPPEIAEECEYMAITTIERLRQEGRDCGIVRFDDKLRVVADKSTWRYRPLITVAVGTVNEMYINADGDEKWRRKAGVRSVSVQYPRTAPWPMRWVSSFELGGELRFDTYSAERVY